MPKRYYPHIYVTRLHDSGTDKSLELNNYNYFSKIGKTVHHCYKRHNGNSPFMRLAHDEVSLQKDNKLYDDLKRNFYAWEIHVKWDMLNLIEATALTMAEKRFGNSPPRFVSDSYADEEAKRYDGSTETFNMTILQGREIVLEAIDRISKAFPEYKIT